jgi:hypothetical protein
VDPVQTARALMQETGVSPTPTQTLLGSRTKCSMNGTIPITPTKAAHRNHYRRYPSQAGNATTARRSKLIVVGCSVLASS